MLDTILTRRSIRKFTDQAVEQDKLDAVLRAAMYAPSAKDCRPWHFIVVTDRSQIEAFQAVHPYSSMLSQAPVLIIVCGDEQQQCAPLYYLEDCAAATENMLLAAHGLGLGACWLGVAPTQERMDQVKRIFGLPEHISAFSGVALGYPAETRQVPERFDPARVHRDRW